MQTAELCQFVTVLLTKTDIIVKKAIQRFNLMVFSNKIIQIIKVKKKDKLLVRSAEEPMIVMESHIFSSATFSNPRHFLKFSRYASMADRLKFCSAK